MFENFDRPAESDGDSAFRVLEMVDTAYDLAFRPGVVGDRQIIDFVFAYVERRDAPLLAFESPEDARLKPFFLDLQYYRDFETLLCDAMTPEEYLFVEEYANSQKRAEILSLLLDAAMADGTMPESYRHMLEKAKSVGLNITEEVLKVRTLAEIADDGSVQYSYFCLGN